MVQAVGAPGHEKNPSGRYATLSKLKRKEVKLMGSVMQNRTVEGLLAYCDWLMEKGYAPVTHVEPWKTATSSTLLVCW